ncbi:MAG: AraC family transcriptional regulator [Lentisphaerae bacterium]|nr:MAG: AraC family transcriptional regulator [Lentisphaerota bacterium]
MDRWPEIEWLECVSFDPTSEIGSPYLMRRIARENWGVHFMTLFQPAWYVYVFWHSGEGIWFDDERREHPLTRGSFLLYGMHTGPEIWTTGDEAMAITTVFFDARDLNPFQVLGSSSPVAGTSPCVEATEGLLRWMLDAGLSAGQNAQRITSHALPALIESCRCPMTAGTGKVTASYRKYVECLSHMQRNIERTTTIEQVADECAIDVSYLCRLFRHYDSTTPYARLSQMRMEHAAAMLGNPRLSISEIAEFLGFSDQYAFSKAFKRVMGAPPSAYRRAPAER